jgi:anti-anti-sigma regulatory factor
MSYPATHPLDHRSSDRESSIPALVVYLYRDADSCIASFNGALTATTRSSIEGVADLITGETRVTLDFSEVDVVDHGGAAAARQLARSVRLRGSKLKVVEPLSARRLYAVLATGSSEPTGRYRERAQPR